MPNPKRALILNVNDTEANRYALTRIMERAGYTLIEATNGRDALATARARSNEIGLVLLDINLPDIGGLEVCRRLKADPATAAIPVLHISATAIEVEDRVTGLESGADAYLCQNVQPAELIATTRALLRVRQAEQALRESEGQYRSLAESIPQMVWTGDANTRATYVNDRWVTYTGQDCQQCLESGWTDAIHPEDRAEDSARWRLATESGGVYEATIRLRRGSDGAYRWHLGRAVPLRDDTGSIVKWFGTLTDIDDQKRAIQELASAEKRKDDFLAMLGHELRSPLAPLTTALRILEHRGHDEKIAARQIEVMNRQVRHIVRLVDDLLDLARISHGKIEVRLAAVSLSTPVREAVENCTPFAALRHHQVSVTYPTPDLIVRADEARLQQVVGNLLHNAIKYSDSHGCISVSVEKSGGFAVIKVKDDGIGILPEMLPHVFDTFVQAERSLDRSDGGLGIGLTLVRQIVELHGGTVEAHSQGAGLGSDFIVRLPLLSTADPVAAEQVQLPPRHHAPIKRRILIVDDNVDAAESLAELVELWGHEALVCHDGIEALAAAADFCPDAIILDIGLPGMNGYEIAARMRLQPKLAGVRMLAMTGYGRDEDRVTSALAGFDAHLTKPISPEYLKQMLSDRWESAGQGPA